MSQTERAKFTDRLQAPIIPVSAIGFHCKSSWSGPHKKVPIFVGDSGVGKTTEVVRVVREDLKWMCQVVPMANFTEGAEWGTMVPDEGMTVLLPLVANFLKEIVDSGKPGVMLLDDVGRCDDMVLKHIFSLVDTRMRRFMQFTLPDTWGVALTMNPASGLYDASPKFRDPAVRRRLRWFWVEPAAEDYMKYARDVKRMFPPLYKFLRSNPTLIHDVKTRDLYEGPYGCPATWDDVDDVIKAMLKNPKDSSMGSLSHKQKAFLESTLASMVGTSVGTSLADFIEKNVGAVDPAEVLEKYHKPASQVRRQIRFFLEQGNNTVISELITALCVVLKERPDPEAITPPLAAFIDDLQQAGMRDLMQVFFRQLKAAPTDDPEYRKYLERLGAYMFRDPAFKRASNGLQAGASRVKDDLRA